MHARLITDEEANAAGLVHEIVAAKPVRKMSEEELEDIRRNAVEYLELWHHDYLSQPSALTHSPG